MTGDDMFSPKAPSFDCIGSDSKHPWGGQDDALVHLASRLCSRLGLIDLARRVIVLWNPRLRTTAGRAQYKKGWIELNPLLQDQVGDLRAEAIRDTFLHELAHLIAHERAGSRKIEPHGEEWRTACRDLGIPDEQRCHDLELRTRRRMVRKHAYACPHCGSVITRVRPLANRAACYTCCKMYNRGRFHENFLLYKVPLEALRARGDESS